MHPTRMRFLYLVSTYSIKPVLLGIFQNFGIQDDLPLFMALSIEIAFVRTDQHATGLGMWSHV